jgi:hypothetical protein
VASTPDRPDARTVRVKVLRCVWETGWSGAAPTRPWPDQVFTEVFQAANGRSVRDFWLRSTFGHADVEFDIGPWAVLQGGAQETLKDDRAGTVAACRRQAERDAVPVAEFDHVVAFVHEPPSDAGPSGGDLVLDQHVRGLTRYREIGRLIGFGPALGRAGWPDDPYCVMGRGDCRVAAATLFRYSPAFRESAGTVRVHAPGTVTLTALSEASCRDPAVAVIPVHGGAVTVEYRTTSGDDAGITPAVVLHSIGLRSAGRAVSFETSLDPAEGAEVMVLGVRATVRGISPTTATVELAGS